MGLFQTLKTGAGSWNPLLWLMALAVAIGVAWYIRSRGRADSRGGPAREPFISGNPEPENAGAHIPATNLYWGFTEALKGWYEKLIPLHTGIITDYVAWFLGIMALMLIIALAG